MPITKCISQLSITILLFSVLAVSFHHHSDVADHPDCSICKTAQVLSSTIKPSPPLLPTLASNTFHDLAINEERPSPSPLLETAYVRFYLLLSIPSAQRPRPLALSDA